MDTVLYAGDVEKYSMGRSTGLRAKNWKTRHIKITRSTFTIYEKATNPTPKFQCPMSAISIIFTDPDPAVHIEANGNYQANMFAIRLFDNGVFTLLVRAHTPEEKTRWLTALREAGERVKGLQYIKDLSGAPGTGAPAQAPAASPARPASSAPTKTPQSPPSPPQAASQPAPAAESAPEEPADDEI